MAKAQVNPFPINTLEQALVALGGSAKTQSGLHIRPFHGHCSSRLVLEGGFPPEWMHPRPAMASKACSNNRYELSYSKAAENPTEQSVLGGMKYKNVDVTVVIPGIGPALGISAKSTGNAFRNLTNRMEEAPGDCVNIHMMYPGFVFGFLHLIKFAKTTEVGSPNDASFDAQDKPLESIVRYHNALSALTGRATITDPQMRYESVGLLVYRRVDGKAVVWPNFPAMDSPIHYSKFFQKLYDTYDLRYAYPDSSGRNHRKLWEVPRGTFPEKIDSITGCSWEPRLNTGDEEQVP
ncbi:MAG: hypothetical protein ABSG07_10535 [Terriglobales bacterium]|jgi:hypothetical protein